MIDYQSVPSCNEISKRIADFLEDVSPEKYNPLSRVQAIRKFEAMILDGCEAKKQQDALIAHLFQKSDGSHDGRVVQIQQDIDAFLGQRELLTVPYTKSSNTQYPYQTFDLDPKRPRKIINQQIFDHAAKVGFPPDFFRDSYFDNVCVFCLPDHTDLRNSWFQDSQFAVCRIISANFEGASLYSTDFYSCDIHSTSFLKSNLAHTYFNDCAFASSTFQMAHLKCCCVNGGAMEHVNFLCTTLDGCSFDRVVANDIRHLSTATITAGGATDLECQRNRASIYKALMGEESATTPRPCSRSTKSQEER